MIQQHDMVFTSSSGLGIVWIGEKIVLDVMRIALEGSGIVQSF